MRGERWGDRREVRRQKRRQVPVPSQLSHCLLSISPLHPVHPAVFYTLVHSGCIMRAFWVQCSWNEVRMQRQNRLKTGSGPCWGKQDQTKAGESESHGQTWGGGQSAEWESEARRALACVWCSSVVCFCTVTSSGALFRITHSLSGNVKWINELK